MRRFGCRKGQRERWLVLFSVAEANAENNAPDFTICVCLRNGEENNIRICASICARGGKYNPRESAQVRDSPRSKSGIRGP